ncbi:hypothetical protein, partial [Pseudomonas viridiflava]|uniref:hypothetical protein n=1 Tax=Pseudomonas viridiflava TaxID=33069 RepID=UPI0013D87BD8
VLVLPKKSFNDFIRHQFQALIFVYLFIKKKVESPSAASRGKPPQRETKKSSCPGRTGLFSFDSKRNKTAGSQFFYPSQ